MVLSLNSLYLMTLCYLAQVRVWSRQTPLPANMVQPYVGARGTTPPPITGLTATPPGNDAALLTNHPFIRDLAILVLRR